MVPFWGELSKTDLWTNCKIWRKRPHCGKSETCATGGVHSCTEVCAEGEFEEERAVWWKMRAGHFVHKPVVSWSFSDLNPWLFWRTNLVLLSACLCVCNSSKIQMYFWTFLENATQRQAYLDANFFFLRSLNTINVQKFMKRVCYGKLHLKIHKLFFFAPV